MGFEAKIYDTWRCTNLHILTALFIKNPKPSCFYCNSSTPKVPSTKDTSFFGKQTVVVVHLYSKKKGNKSRAMKEKWEDSGGLSLSHITHSLFLSSTPQPAKATGRCSIALQMDQEWHTYSYICLAHSYFLLYITCQPSQAVARFERTSPTVVVHGEEPVYWQCTINPSPKIVCALEPGQ